MGERDHGAATVIVVAVLGIVLSVVGGALVVLRVAASRTQLSAAADLAVLAAATAGDCSAARSVAAANGATVTECTRDGPDFQVATTASVPVLPGRTLRLVARARAGPP